MYQSDTAPWLEFFAWNTDGSAKTDLVYNTSGISIVVVRDNQANSSALTLSAASGPTDWAAGKFWAMGGNKYRVGIATASISSFTGKISVEGTYTGGVITGVTEYVTAYNPAGNPNTTTPPTVAAIADEVQTRTIARVTLVDTCTTNTDMRGTDNAALAATALSTAVWTATIAGRIDADISSRATPGDVSPTINFSPTIEPTELSAGSVSAIQSGLALESSVQSVITTLSEGVELDPATLVRFVTEDTGETAAAAGSVAKLAQGSGSGGSTTVTVLPATGIVANRSAGVTLTPVVGETISQAITVYQSDGTTAVDLSGKTLKIIFETMSGADVAVVLAADITIGGTDGNVVTFAYPSAVTASERTLRFAIRDAAAPLTMYLQGVCSVVAAPKVDA